MDPIIFRMGNFPPPTLRISNFKITFPHFLKSLNLLFSPQLKAQETKVIQETKGQKFGDFVAYSLLSQRHLRHTVTLLQDCHRLRNAALKSQKEGTGLELLVVEVKLSLFFGLKLSKFGLEPGMGCWKTSQTLRSCVCLEKCF